MNDIDYKAKYEASLERAKALMKKCICPRTQHSIRFCGIDKEITI